MVTTPDTSVTYKNIWPDKLTFLAFLSIFIWYCSSLLFSPDIVRICVELYQYFCPFIMIFSVLYGYSKFPDFITARMHYLAWLEQGCRISSHGKRNTCLCNYFKFHICLSFPLLRSSGPYKDRRTGPNRVLGPNMVPRTNPNQGLGLKKDRNTDLNQVLDIILWGWSCPKHVLRHSGCSASPSAVICLTL